LKLWGILSALAVFLVLSVGISDFPPFGDPGQPSALHVVPRYVERTVEETGVPNVVTSILADYRGYDTNFETTVIFTAGIAVIMLLGGLGVGRTLGRSDN